MKSIIITPALKYKFSLLGCGPCGSIPPIAIHIPGNLASLWFVKSEWSASNLPAYKEALILFSEYPLSDGLVRLGQEVLIVGLGTPKKWKELKFEAIWE